MYILYTVIYNIMKLDMPGRTPTQPQNAKNLDRTTRHPHSLKPFPESIPSGNHGQATWGTNMLWQNGIE